MCHPGRWTTGFKQVPELLTWTFLVFIRFETFPVFITCQPTLFPIVLIDDGHCSNEGLRTVTAEAKREREWRTALWNEWMVNTNRVMRERTIEGVHGWHFNLKTSTSICLHWVKWRREKAIDILSCRSIHPDFSRRKQLVNNHLWRSQFWSVSISSLRPLLRLRSEDIDTEEERIGVSLLFISHSLINRHDQGDKQRAEEKAASSSMFYPSHLGVSFFFVDEHYDALTLDQRKRSFFVQWRKTHLICWWERWSNINDESSCWTCSMRTNIAGQMQSTNLMQCSPIDEKRETAWNLLRPVPFDFDDDVLSRMRRKHWRVPTRRKEIDRVQPTPRRPDCL